MAGVKSPSLRSASQSPSDRAYNLPGAGGSTVTNVHTKKYECGCQEIVREYTTTIDGGCGKEACPCGCADVDSGMNRLSSTMVIQPSQDPSLKRAGSVCCCDTQQIIHCPDEKPCDCGDGCNCETMWAKRVDYAQNEPFESGPPASHDTRLHCPDEKACDCNFNCDCPTVWRSLQPTTDKEDSPLKPALLTPRSPTGKLHCPDEKPCDCPFQCDCPVKWQQVKSTTCPTDKDCDCSPCSPNELPERNCECIAWEETVHKDTQTTFNLKKRSRTVECEPATSETFDEPKPIFDLSQDDGSTTCRVYPYRRHTTGTSEPVTTSASQYTGDSTTVCDSEEEPGCCWKFWCCGRKKRKKIGEARSESSKSSRKYEKERRKREKREKKMARMKERKGKKKKERKHKKKKEKKRRRKKKKTNDSEC